MQYKEITAVYWVLEGFLWEGWGQLVPFLFVWFFLSQMICSNYDSILVENN